MAWLAAEMGGQADGQCGGQGRTYLLGFHSLVNIKPKSDRRIRHLEPTDLEIAFFEAVRSGTRGI
jgi:hypothetical protein